MEDAEALEGIYKGKITLLFRGCFTGFIIVEGLEGRRQQVKPGDYLVDSSDFGLFVLDARCSINTGSRKLCLKPHKEKIHERIKTCRHRSVRRRVRQAPQAVVEVAEIMRSEMDAVKRKHINDLKLRVSAAASKKQMLVNALEANKALFDKPAPTSSTASR